MAKEKILIVEDEKEIVKLLTYNFEKEGYQVLTASDGEAGLALAKSKRPQMIILDLMLPKVDGIEVCKQIRRDSQVPIIMLTAKKEETDRVLGLELGADDYVTKPFSVRELVARVKSLFRRSKEKAWETKLVQIGKLEVDLERYEVKLSGKLVELSSKEFTFLKILLSAQGKVLTRDQLLESVWGYEQASEIDTRTVDQHVARLRVKLGSEASRLATVKNIGYKFKLA
ncbi:MAG: DNA-binding response regulator [Elusimicrobia bacterium RIFCSPLOWO2_01_FULL_54_10]|nr:MAG: DNA-binding response regulator [Elusimicrobia bacterium RIFCSPLOWO2_01_FULL_54_10]